MSERLVKSQHTHLSLAGGRISFFPGFFITILSKQPTFPVLVKFHSQEFSLSFRNYCPKFPHILRNFLSKLVGCTDEPL